MRILRLILVIFLLSVFYFIAVAQPVWQQCARLDGGTVFRVLIDHIGNLYADAQEAGTFYSSDSGANWSIIPNSMNYGFHLDAIDSQNRIYAFFSDTLVRSTDHGATWAPLTFFSRSDTLNSQLEWCFIDHHDRIYVSQSLWSMSAQNTWNLIFRSNDSGATWLRTSFLTNAGPSNLLAFTASDTIIGGGGYGNISGIWRSTDLGDNWTQIPDNSHVQSISTIGDTVILNDGIPNSIKISNDAGTNWRTVASPNYPIAIDAVYPFTIIVNSAFNGWYCSTNLGQSWTTYPSHYYTFSISHFGSHWYAATETGLVRLPLLPSSETLLNHGLYGTQGGNLTITNSNLLLYGIESGTFRSTNRGDTWYTNTGDSLVGVINKSVTGTLFANHTSLNRIGVSRSTDNGFTWQNVVSGLPDSSYITSFVSENPNRVYAIIPVNNRSILYRSADDGLNWQQALNIGLDSTYPELTCLQKNDSCLFGLVITDFDYGEIIRSYDEGDHWQFVTTHSTANRYLIKTDRFGYLYSVNQNGIYRSTTLSGDARPIWSSYFRGGAQIHFLEFDSLNRAYVGWSTDNETCYIMSSDSGHSWQSMGNGLPYSGPWSMAWDNNNYLYVTIRAGVFHTATPFESIHDVRWVQFPNRLELLPNYPNPFNSNTTIRFALSQPSSVTLTVSDILGRNVRELFTQFLTAGNHTYQWNANGLASGSYFIKLQSAQGQSSVRKLQLLK